MMATLQEKIVIFIDVLGFSNLTLENSLDIERIVDREGPLDQIFSSLINEERKPNKLEEVFSNFHFILQSGFDLAKLNSKFTSITFSDSAYISTNYLNDAVKIVTNLMCGFIRNKVPVRAGIALGSFETLRFKTDIKLDSGEHASHFLGTGVVKAFHAESCGIKPNFPKKLYLCHARELDVQGFENIPLCLGQLCEDMTVLPRIFNLGQRLHHIDKRHINTPFIGIIIPMNGQKSQAKNAFSLDL